MLERGPTLRVSATRKASQVHNRSLNLEFNRNTREENGGISACWPGVENARPENVKELPLASLSILDPSELYSEIGWG
jgi:hypothetical protein